MLTIVSLLLAASVALAAILAFFFTRNTRTSTADTGDRDQVNLAIAEDNRQLLTESLTQDDVEEASTEVDAALLADIGHESPNQSRATNLWPMRCVAILIPLVALGLYWFAWGQPGTVILQEAAALLHNGEEMPNTEAIVAHLEDYLEIHPDDTKAWVSLMSFHWYLGDRGTFRKAHKDAELAGHVSTYGDSLRILDAFSERRLNLSPYEQQVRSRLEAANANSAVIAMLKGIEFTAEGSLLQANRAWEDILGQSDLFGLHQTASLGQRAMRQRLEPPDFPKIVVDVSLEQAFPDKSWLFVYARETEQSPPLAVTKRLVGPHRRFELTLDDSLAMQPTQKLSTADELVISARLSATADVLSQDGDLVVSSSSVKPNEQPRVQLKFGRAQRVVLVNLNADFEVLPTEAVFIIVKKRDVRTPPLAVRKVHGPLPKEGIEVSFSDAMLPHVSEFSTSELEVVARWSNLALAQMRPENVSSATKPFTLGDAVPLTLTKPITDSSE